MPASRQNQLPTVPAKQKLQQPAKFRKPIPEAATL
jgi:hypothetical protein